MPYIITTTGPRHVPFDDGDFIDGTAVTRTAVATLDEARDFVHNMGADYGTMAHLDCVLDGTSRMPIGPLPDGTVIEVTSVSWNWIIAMADDAGIDTDAVYEEGAQDGRGDLAILAAYLAVERARQVTCFCPDDCNCRHTHRTNYCGCAAHTR